MNQCPNVLQVDNVYKSFGNKIALNNVSFEMSSGCILALLGPNGAGKSTLVQIISTLTSPDDGDVYVSGLSVSKNAGKIRESIGLTGQTPSVDEALTVEENIRLLAVLRGLNRYALSGEVSLRLTQVGLESEAKQLVRTLSGGLRRRLDLAASLIGSPRLLILDEPTTGLDPRSRAQFWDLLKTISQDGVDLLLTTQYLDEADALADTIVIIDEGRLVAKGTPESLKNGLGRDIVSIRCRSADGLSTSAAILKSVASSEPSLDTDSKTLTIPVSLGTASLFECAKRLNEYAVEVEDVSLRRPTLDEVFLAITADEGDSDVSGNTNLF